MQCCDFIGTAYILNLMTLSKHVLFISVKGSMIKSNMKSLKYDSKF